MKILVDGVQYAPISVVDPVDFLKLESPFVRHEGEMFQEINSGYEWVFEDDDVICSEKIDGTNVSITIQGGQLTGVYNRKNKIEIGILKTNRFLQGVRNAYEKERFNLNVDGQFFGELMGPKVQKNFLKLAEPMWYPFSYLRKKFHYKSWGRYPKDYKTISDWFENDIFSLVHVYYTGEKVPPEGVVFYQPSTGYMAKLRRDMFPWFAGKKHKEKELTKKAITLNERFR